MLDSAGQLVRSPLLEPPASSVHPGDGHGGTLTGGGVPNAIRKQVAGALLQLARNNNHIKDAEWCTLRMLPVCVVSHV